MDAPDRDLRALPWEFLVEDVLTITGRGRFAIGVIRQGTIRVGDRFVAGERLGQVRAVEGVNKRGRVDLVGLGVDIELRGGDVLRRHEPTAAAAD